MRSWLVRIWASLLGLVQEPAVPTSRRDANRHRSRRSGHFRRAALLRLEPLEDRTAPATFLLKDIRPGASGSFPQQMVNVNGVIFFIANDGSTGYELWKSDGTSGGTVLVKDIRPGPGSGFYASPIFPENPPLINVNGTLFFVANDGTNGYELWKSDGTSSGTVLVRDINPGTGSAFGWWWPNTWFTNVNGTLYFVANDGTTGLELWKSDGTSTGTRLVRNINPGGNSSYPRYLTNVSGTLFFSADDGTKGHELWKSDGTPGGTVLVRDIWPASGHSYPRHLANVNGTLFFAADDGTNGWELWKSNGTSTGTVLVKDIRPGPPWDPHSHPYSLTNVGGRLFFIADNGTNGRELWISDGTSTGTVLLKDINQGAGHAFGTLNAPLPSFTNVNGTLFFIADDGLYGFELWKSDGTAGGTVRVKDINPGANWAFSNASPPSLTNVRGTLFFAADDGTNGRELWKSNGTDAGTVLVRDIRPGANSSNPQWLAEAGGLLFFQANDGTSGAELWVNTDNVQPTTIVNIIAPPDGTYRLGATLDFTVQFSRTVSVDTSGGTPRLAINLTSGTHYADYVSGSGTDRLVFRYTVQANDFDNNGITLVSPLDLNGGSIVDGFGNTPTLTFTPPNTSGILVDAVVPTVVQVLLPASGIYLTGQNLDFRFRFSKPVLVDTSGGTPRLRVQIGSTVRFADYFSGSGGDTLTFRYTVQASDFDDDGIELIQPLELNGGTMQDPAGNAALLGFTPPDASGILVNVLGPTIVSVTPPAPNIYMTGQDLDFLVRFSAPVVVDTSGGTPRLALTIGSQVRYADYVSGSNTDTLTFRYTVQASDFDNDGITVANRLERNGGTIRDTSGHDAGLRFVPPDTRDVLVNVVGPVIVSVTPPANGTYLAGQNLDFQVRFDRSVIVDTTGGSPSLQLIIGATVRQAGFVSTLGSDTLLFRYTVQPGEFDDDGIQLISPVLLNGSTIKDGADNPALLRFTPPDTSGIRIGQPAPSVQSVTVPAPGWYRIGQVLTFDFNFGQTVFVNTSAGTPQVQLVIGSTTRLASYVSGSGTNVLRFRYVIQAGESDDDGIAMLSPILLNGGTIRNVFGSNASVFFTPPSASGVLVDGVAPQIVAVSGPANGIYLAGQNLDFTVRFSEPVFVSSSGTLPRLALVIGSTTRFASYQSGSGSDTLRFRYTVQPGDRDADGITLASGLDLNGAAIRDRAQNDAGVSFTPPDTSGVRIGLTAPTIVSLQIPPAGVYQAGDVLQFRLRFSEPVTVSGTPQLHLMIGSTDRFADYVSGSGSDTLIFRYTVIPGELDTDGITLVAPLELNGGTIRDLDDGFDASLSFTPPDTSAIRVDATGPVIDDVLPPADGLYRRGQNLDFRLLFSEPVFVTGSPRIALNIGGRNVFAVYVSGSSTDTLVFRYRVQSGDLDLDGVSMAATIDLNGGAIRNGSGSNASLSFAVPDTSQVRVDGVAPGIIGVLGPRPGTYRIGQILTVNVQFSEPVVVGTTASARPYIRLQIGRFLRNATYATGSGTNTLQFRYQVQPGDLDSDGIEIVSPILRPPGTFIRDRAGNDADTAFSPPDSSGVRVDGVAPTIVSVTPPATGRYITGQALEITIRFSEPVQLTGSGRPYVLLRIGSNLRQAELSAQVNGTTLRFRYVIRIPDRDFDGIEILSPVILPSGVTLTDAAGNAAILNFVPPSTRGVLVN
jgi:ELWxxDGT repeat protein